MEDRRWAVARTGKRIIPCKRRLSQPHVIIVLSRAVGLRRPPARDNAFSRACDISRPHAKIHLPLTHFKIFTPPLPLNHFKIFTPRLSSFLFSLSSPLSLSLPLLSSPDFHSSPLLTFVVDEARRRRPCTLASGAATGQRRGATSTGPLAPGSGGGGHPLHGFGSGGGRHDCGRDGNQPPRLDPAAVAVPPLDSAAAGGINGDVTRWPWLVAAATGRPWLVEVTGRGGDRGGRVRVAARRRRRRVAAAGCVPAAGGRRFSLFFYFWFFCFHAGGIII
ncbi:hypothetical protein [Oryza sativa Japonica Group]|uniref:Uncharacterized protein n=1 Tax=Oryza sativa subsp. japonica TaxID=39947 RepID=Q656Z2_ORYSJ|nr:hypothetical protein [Oryza sativa Japonica Group]